MNPNKLYCLECANTSANSRMWNCARQHCKDGRLSFHDNLNGFECQIMYYNVLANISFCMPILCHFATHVHYSVTNLVGPQ